MGLICFHSISVAQATDGFGDSDKIEIEELLDRYVHAYSVKDYTKLRECLQAPFVRSSDALRIDGASAAWDVMEAMDGVMAYYRKQRDALDAKGYDHSEYLKARITALSASRAFVDRIYRRYRKDGTLLEETSVIYIVSKLSGAWKVCGTMTQDLKYFGVVY
jgi:hypothetical protein